MPFAKSRGVWPRTEPKIEPTAPIESGGGASTAGGGAAVSLPAAPIQPPSDLLITEGVLKEALTQLWEKSRARKIERIHLLRIRMFDAGDAFKLLGVLGSVQGARKVAKLSGGYETAEGGRLEFEFSGPSTDAQVLKEFLDPQLRAASEKTLNAEFELQFDGGLSVTTDAPERLADRLTRYASGAAYVTAMAETKSPLGSTGAAGAAVAT
jgi:hypothetical protein